jgi:hypothetical protein
MTTEEARQDLADIVVRMYLLSLHVAMTDEIADKALTLLKARLAALSLTEEDYAAQVALAVSTAQAHRLLPPDSPEDTETPPPSCET